MKPKCSPYLKLLDEAENQHSQAKLLGITLDRPTLFLAQGLTEDDKSRRYKVIIANPPFAGLLPRDSIRSDLPWIGRISALERSARLTFS